MPLLYFDYFKSADFGSEKKLVQPFFIKKIAIFCGTFYFAPKALKQSIWSIAVATISQNMSEFLF